MASNMAGGAATSPKRKTYKKSVKMKKSSGDCPKDMKGMKMKGKM